MYWYFNSTNSTLPSVHNFELNRGIRISTGFVAFIVATVAIADYIDENRSKQNKLNRVCKDSYVLWCFVSCYCYTFFATMNAVATFSDSDAFCKIVSFGNDSFSLLNLSFMAAVPFKLIQTLREKNYGTAEMQHVWNSRMRVFFAFLIISVCFSFGIGSVALITGASVGKKPWGICYYVTANKVYTLSLLLQTTSMVALLFVSVLGFFLLPCTSARQVLAQIPSDLKARLIGHAAIPLIQIMFYTPFTVYGFIGVFKSDLDEVIRFITHRRASNFCHVIFRT